MDEYIDRIICGDCLEVMKGMPDECVDLVVTSPPYDNLRDYHGYSLDVPAMCLEFMRIVKQGGVIVWVVGDATVNGSETGTSFRQALTFMDVGFNLHDTMIWNKGGFSAVGALAVRYAPVFEYMFIFSKGKPRVLNLLKDRKTLHAGSIMNGTIRQKDGTNRPMSSSGKIVSEYSQRYNIWNISPQRQCGNDRHPAPFPEQLACDHIISWSNEGDLVLDPMCGSGTTCKMALKTGRHYIGIDISEEYCEIARERIRLEQSQLKLDLFTKAAAG